MTWLIAIALLIFVILFFPIRFHLHFLKIGEDEPEISIKLWRWSLWTSATPASPVTPAPAGVSSPSEPPASSTSQGDSHPGGNDQPVAPAPSVTPAEPSAVTPAPTVTPASAGVSSPSEPPASSAQQGDSRSSGNDQTDPNRPLYALALHPTLEKEALRLLYRILRNAWRIFKLRIPTLRVHYGMENPAQLGMIAGGFWGMHGLANAPEGWEFVPAWDKPGLSALQSHANVTITVFRILRFILLSLFAMIRFAWITWRIYKQYKADPRMSNLAAWRRWILQKLAPLVEEVQNDQA